MFKFQLNQEELYVKNSILIKQNELTVYQLYFISYQYLLQYLYTKLQFMGVF